VIVRSEEKCVVHAVCVSFVALLLEIFFAAIASTLTLEMLLETQ